MLRKRPREKRKMCASYLSGAGTFLNTTKKKKTGTRKNYKGQMDKRARAGVSFFS